MTISLVSALALRENMVALTFDGPVYYTRVLDNGDAFDVTRYIISVDPSSVDGEGEPIRPVLPAQADRPVPNTIHLWVDRRFSSFPAPYLIDVNGLLHADTLEPLDVHNATFHGLRAGLPAPSTDSGISNRDIANPQVTSQTPQPGGLGTYPVDETGDVARDEGLVSFKKRVLRRLGTKKGAYPQLPGYGITAYQSVKALARPGVVDSIAKDAEDQIRQEPETINVKVRVVMQDSLAYFRVKVRCSFGTVEFSAPVLVQG